MDKSKSQLNNFCYEALPALFHKQPNEFLKLIERDGLKFLKFWWEYVGDKLPADKKSSFEGMDYDIKSVGKVTKVIFITLPRPKLDGDMYFVALVVNPPKNFAWIRLPNQSFLCLVRRSKDLFETGTQIGDLTPKAIFVPIGPGPEPTLEAFTKVALEIAEKRPT